MGLDDFLLKTVFRVTAARLRERRTLLNKRLKEFGLRAGMTACLCLLMASIARAAPPLKIWDSRVGKQISQKALLNSLARVDVVFVGEQHDDPATHALELQILQALHGRAGARLRLAMEMWERDTQPALDSYLQGKTDEATFLKASRPWTNYKTDYRPLVEYARAQHIPVVASNAPQSLISRVGKEGLAAIPVSELPPLVQAPHDDYWDRFRETMAGMGGAHGAMDPAATQRFYEAQVVRDETMAAGTVQALAGADHPLVLHVNGQFHSDFGGGIPRRVLWRRPLTRVLIVSVVPVSRMPSALSADQVSLADFVVFVPLAAPSETRRR